MKYVTAVFKPSRLDAVLDAVTAAGASGVTVTEVRGYGRQQGKTEVYRGAEYEVRLLPKVRIEVAVSDAVVEKIVDATLSPCCASARARRTRPLSARNWQLAPCNQAAGVRASAAFALWPCPCFGPRPYFGARPYFGPRNGM